MGQKYCTICGARLSGGLRFCEQCGSPVVPGPAGGRTILAIVAAVIVLVVAAAVVLYGLPALSGTHVPQGLLPGPAATTVATPVATTPAVTSAATPVPTEKPDPFPNASRLGDRIPFGSGSVSSEATVYRYWINDTYEWHNDMDNHYYVEKPAAGKKFLFVFVHLENKGDTRVWFPPAGRVIAFNNGIQYTEDRNHYKPNKASDEDATPVEVKEVQYYHKLGGEEYAEDFGFSHGTELAYLYPGASNAVDGYVIYQVPRSLTPEETYVVISFNGQDQGIWRLG